MDYQIPPDILEYIQSLGFEQKEGLWFEASDNRKMFNFFLSVSNRGIYKLSSTGLEPDKTSVIFRGYKVESIAGIKFLFNNSFTSPIMTTVLQDY